MISESRNEISKDILLEIKTCLPASKKFHDSLERSLEAAQFITAMFKELKLFKQKKAPRILMEMMNAYKQRVHSFLNFIDSITPEESKDDRIRSFIISCYDEMLMIFLLAFSIYDGFHKNVLDRTFRRFLIKNNLLKSKYENLKLIGNIVRRSTLFDAYNFPIVLGMFLPKSDELKTIFTQALNLRQDECDEQMSTFIESFIYLMGIRNQIAHMSKEQKLYSIENMKTNAKMLATYFYVFQTDLERLLKFFYALADMLKTKENLK